MSQSNDHSPRERPETRGAPSHGPSQDNDVWQRKEVARGNFHGAVPVLWNKRLCQGLITMPAHLQKHSPRGRRLKWQTTNCFNSITMIQLQSHKNLTHKVQISSTHTGCLVCRFVFVAFLVLRLASGGAVISSPYSINVTIRTSFRKP